MRLPSWHCGWPIEIDGVAELIDRPVEIGPFSSDLEVGLIDPPAARDRPAPLPAQMFFHFGSIGLNPTVNRGMIDLRTAFGNHLFKILIADAVLATPTDCPKHHFAREMAILKRIHEINVSVRNIALSQYHLILQQSFREGGEIQAARSSEPGWRPWRS